MINNFAAPGRRLGGCLTNAATPLLTSAGQRLLEEMMLLASGPTAF
jgi:hypothetical protein